MLEEAVEVIRELWQGELITHHGEHYTVDNARLYTLPEEPPPIAIAAAGRGGGAGRTHRRRARLDRARQGARQAFEQRGRCRTSRATAS